MTEVDLDDLEAGLDGEVPVYRLGGALYSGRVNETKSGRLVSTFVAMDGYKDGEELIFGDSGELAGRLHYAGGVTSGRVEYFHPGGALEEDASFEHGICLQSITYDPSGAVTQRYELSKESFEYRQLERYRLASKRARVP
jgi:antitoxin component YwqK of YwqJK toxin-antitoxin module